jgi:phage gp29-like protein
MADMDIVKTEFYKEILASDQLYMYQGFASSSSVAIPSDPSLVWQWIQFNPWWAAAVFQDMELKDAMVASCLDTRKDGVLSLPRMVLPASDSKRDKKIAAFMEETLHDYFDGNLLIQDGARPGFDGMLWEALDAVGNGVSIGEIVFAEGRDRVYVKAVNFKPSHLFAFGETGLAAYSTSSMAFPSTGPLRLRQGIFLEGVPDTGLLPESKFMVLSYRPRYGNRWGSPLKLKVYWSSWIKRAALRNWLKFAEKGTGSVVAKYRPGSGPNEQEKALEVAMAVNDEPSVAIPESMTLEVLEHVRQNGGAYKELVDEFCNSEIARAILGQTLTSRGSDGGGSRALGEVHNDVRQEKIEADAKALMAAVNMRLVWPLTLLNFGPNVPPPVWTLQYDPGADQTALAGWLKALWQMNVKIDKKWTYASFQLPEPDESDPDSYLKPPVAAGGIAQADYGDEADGDGGPDAGAKKKKEDPLDSEHVSDHSEGKKKASPRNRSARPSSSRTERFRRLRPSMIEFSEK